MPWQVEGETLYHVVDAGAPRDEQPAVVFTGRSWAEAEQYVGDVGGG